MKNPYVQERNNDIRKAYDEIIHASGVNARFLSRDVIIEILLSRPAPKYYICIEWARRYVYKYLRGEETLKGELNAKLIREIADKYVAYKQSHRFMKSEEVWGHVLNSQASSFFVTPRTMKEVIYKYNGRS